jgi:hypothetical protein
MGELANLLHVHVRTVQLWHKKGMVPIEPAAKPMIFMGSEARRYLDRERIARRCPIGEDEFLCPRCRQARHSRFEDVCIVDTGMKMGRIDSQVEIRGICQVCDCQLIRFSTRRRVEASVWMQIQRQRQTVLSGDAHATVNTDFQGGKNDDGKQQE